MNISKLKEYLSIVKSNPAYAFRAFLRKLKSKNTFDYHFLGGKAFMPSVLHFEVTHHCNLNCFMCSLYNQDEASSSLRSKIETNPLDLDTLANLFKQLKKFSPLINIVGGEPLLYKNLKEFISLARTNSLDVSITTNGYLLKDYADFLVEQGVCSIIVSLDGPAQLHNQMRGRPEVYENALEGIKKVLAAKKSKGKKFPRVKISPCITNRNYINLYDLLLEIKDLEIDAVSISHLWYWTDEMVNIYNQNDTEKMFEIEPQNWKAYLDINVVELIKQITLVKSTKFNFPVSFFPDLELSKLDDYYSRPLTKIKTNCLSPWREAIILPDGEIIFCVDYILGNIKDSKLKQIWNSEKAIRFRKRIKEKGLFPICRRCCGLFTY